MISIFYDRDFGSTRTGTDSSMKECVDIAQLKIDERGERNGSDRA